MACDVSGADGSTKFTYDRVLSMGPSASLRILPLCCRDTHEKDSLCQGGLLGPASSMLHHGIYRVRSACLHYAPAHLTSLHPAQAPKSVSLQL